MSDAAKTLLYVGLFGVAIVVILSLAKQTGGASLSGLSGIQTWLSNLFTGLGPETKEGPDYVATKNIFGDFVATPKFEGVPVGLITNPQFSYDPTAVREAIQASSDGTFSGSSGNGAGPSGGGGF